MEEVEDSPDFWSGPVQSYNSPVQHRFLIGLDRSTNSPLPDPSRQKQVYNRRTVRTVLSPTITTTGGQSGPCQLGLWPQVCLSPDHASWDDLGEISKIYNSVKICRKKLALIHVDLHTNIKIRKFNPSFPAYLPLFIKLWIFRMGFMLFAVFPILPLGYWIIQQIYVAL